MRRDVFRHQVWSAAPFRVVHDSDLLALAVWPSVEGLAPTTWIEHVDFPADAPAATYPSIANVVVTSQSPSGLRVLLLHPSDVDTDDGDWVWVPPGGQREPGEDIATCARRELEEETGIKADPDPVHAKIHKIQIGDKVVQVNVAAFHVDVPWHTQVRLSHEHTDSEWVAVEQVHERCRPAAALDTVLSVLHLGRPYA